MKPKIHDIVIENAIPNRKNLNVSMGFDRKNKIWRFIGYSCGKCGQSLKTVYVAKKHVCQATVLRRQLRNDMEELNIKTVDGRVWKSIVLDN